MSWGTSAPGQEIPVQPYDESAYPELRRKDEVLKQDNKHLADVIKSLEIPEKDRQLIWTAYAAVYGKSSMMANLWEESGPRLLHSFNANITELDAYLTRESKEQEVVQFVIAHLRYDNENIHSQAVQDRRGFNNFYHQNINHTERHMTSTDSTPQVLPNTNPGFTMSQLPLVGRVFKGRSG